MVWLMNGAVCESDSDATSGESIVSAPRPSRQGSRCDRAAAGEHGAGTVRHAASATPRQDRGLSKTYRTRAGLRRFSSVMQKQIECFAAKKMRASAALVSDGRLGMLLRRSVAKTKMV